MPIRFWGYYIKALVYLMNRLPSATLNNESSYELLYLKKIILSYLRVIRGLYYISVLPRGYKFSERVILDILIGYSKLQKSYLLFDIQSKKLSVNGNVIFIVELFPFS